MDKNQELIKIKETALPILKKHGVSKAGIFGSYARGENRKRSDIDILIKIRADASLTDIIGLQLELKKAFKKKVDVVEYEVIRPELKKRILNDEVRIL